MNIPCVTMKRAAGSGLLADYLADNGFPGHSEQRDTALHESGGQLDL